MNRSAIAFLLFVIFTSFAQFAHAQQTTNSMPVVSGDLNKPYEVMDGILQVQSVKETFFANAFQDAIAEGFKTLQKNAQKAGGDAVINTSVQLAIYPAKTPSGEMGQIVIFGTLVKLKSETK